jgi:lantibiotic leader peptide-processing serine protease
MRKVLFVAVALVAAAMTGVLSVGSDAGSDSRPTRYIVLYDAGASPALVRAGIQKAGGKILRANNKVGVATAISSNAKFLSRASAAPGIKGVARNMPIGRAKPQLRPKAKLIPELNGDLKAAGKLKAAPTKRSSASGYHASQPEPLAHHQWDMQQIHATVDGSYKKEKGSKRVLVGILDTGVDGTHPDIAPNFSNSLSRNFTTDDPLVDGPCAEENDASCNDAADRDENGHGTHVASTVASPINGLGMAGVAPSVTIVNLRAGQDSGYFFLQPSVDALTYAGDNGVDVVNMSYYIDPWLYNCRDNAADSPAERMEQATIIEATNRALDYAHDHGVTLVGAAGNSHHNMILPTFDGSSPDYPPGTEHDRTVDNKCLDMPTEGNNVISVSSTGKTKAKADYSNYGYGEIDVAAPGGYSRDDPWSLSMTPAERAAVVTPNLILAALPKNVADEAGVLNPDGSSRTASVVRDCKGSVCAYYQWIQGTSMASPHAAGVAALIVSQYGHRRSSGITLDPHFTKAYLLASATEQPCMTPNPYSYTHKGRDASYTFFCEGTETYNGAYGHGIVDALNAVEIGHDVAVD